MQQPQELLDLRGDASHAQPSRDSHLVDAPLGNLSEMSQDTQGVEPTQTTPEGATIPVPTRDAVLRDLAKVAPPVERELQRDRDDDAERRD